MSLFFSGKPRLDEVVSRWANGEGVRLVFIVGLTGDRSDDLMLSRGPVVEVYAKWKSWGEFVLVDEFGGKYEHDSVKILAGNEIKQFVVIDAAESCRLFDIALPEGIAEGMQSLKIDVSWEGQSKESGRPFRHACEVEVKPLMCKYVDEPQLDQILGESTGPYP